MNDLNPEERRAKAEEIARLLEREPMLAQDLGNLIKPATRVLLSHRVQRSSAVCSTANGTQI